MGNPGKRAWTSSRTSSIVSECESFLAGSYAQHLQSVGRTVPAWAWLNRLSHGSLAELRSLASGHGGRQGDPASAAIRFLAGELLARADDDAASVAALQRDVLVPEELALASRWKEPLTAGQLVSCVLAGLNRYDEDRRRQRHGREAA
jgi:hypothetical protein